MDVKTLFFTDALINVTCGLVCLLLWHNRTRDRCLGWWGAGLTLFGLIDATYPFSNATPIVNAAGYSALDIATISIWFGFRSFDGKPAMTPLLLLIPFSPLTACLLVDLASGNRGWGDDAALFVHCAVALGQAHVVWKGSTSATDPRRICAYAIYVIAGSIALPLVNSGSWLTISQNAAFSLIVDHVMTIVITLNLIGMISTRDFNAVLRASLRDPLTGLLNRKGLFEAMSHVSQDRSVLMIDLDYFKLINDRFGHEGGDDVLRCFARRISDTIGDRGIFARLGGEEFVIVLNMHSLEDATGFAELVRIDAAGQPVQSGQRAILFTVSIGVALYTNGEDIFCAIRRADEALYQAKANGRNCVAQQASRDLPLLAGTRRLRDIEFPAGTLETTGSPVPGAAPALHAANRA